MSSLHDLLAEIRLILQNISQFIFIEQKKPYGLAMRKCIVSFVKIMLPFVI